METKKCSVCKETKPIDEFFDKGKGKDARCKVCRLAYNRKRYAETVAPHTKNYTYGNIESKVCSICHVKKPVSEFNLHHAKTKGESKYRSECKICQTIYRKENAYKYKEGQRLYNIQNAEKIKKRRDEYRSNLDNREKAREYAKEYQRNNPQRQRDRTLKQYGITQQDYDTMLESQNFGCAICGTKKNGRKKNFVVDHDHKTGVVRGLLCTQCNAGLGNYKDNPESIRRAIEYLNKH